MSLSDTDKRKTVAEYLGLTGTKAEIREELEKDARVYPLMDEILGVRNRREWYDSKRLPFSFVGRSLQPDEDVLTMTIEALMSDRDKLEADLKKEYAGMQGDIAFQYGAKKKLLLETAGYTYADGNDTDFFMRYWRSPLTKLLAYRGIDPNTPDGKRESLRILEKLFGGVNVPMYPFQDMVQMWPEKLVEDHEAISAKYNEKYTELENLMIFYQEKPFIEILAFMEVPMSNPADLAQTAVEVSQSERAKRLLARFFPTTEEYDPELFATVLPMSPVQIQANSDELKGMVRLRNNERYLTAHPNATFQEFARERYPYSLDGIEPSESAAMRELLGVKSRFDDAVLSRYMKTPCKDLIPKTKKIVRQALWRRRRERLWISSVLLTALIVLGTVGYQSVKAVRNGINHFRGGADTAEVSARADQKQSEIQQEAKAVAATGQKEQTAQPIQIGDLNVLGTWQGYKDAQLSEPVQNAPMLLIWRKFVSILAKMDSAGKTFDQVFDPMSITKRIKPTDQSITIDGAGDFPETKIYYDPQAKGYDGKTNYENLVLDVQCAGWNIRDMLKTIPVPKKRLAKAQVEVMEALQLSMIWSKDQQESWAQQNPEVFQQAYQAISRQAEQTIASSGKKDAESIFMATVDATAKYSKETQGGNPALGLIMSRVYADAATRAGHQQIRQNVMTPDR